MIVERTKWGRRIIIPETEVNSKFVYDLREVRKINDNEPYEQDLINRLEIPEQKAIRKLTLLLFSMENYFKFIEQNGIAYAFDRWESRNRMNWNDWYHNQARMLEEEINNYSFEYADKSKHGWCL